MVNRIERQRSSKTSTVSSPGSAAITRSLETLIKAVSTGAETDPGHYFSRFLTVDTSALGFSRTPGLLQASTVAKNLACSVQVGIGSRDRFGRVIKVNRVGFLHVRRLFFVH